MTTTTTLTAPLVLVWFQMKHLRWLVAALAVGWVGSAYLHRGDLIHDLYGTGGMTPLVFFGFLSVLFTVLLFGMEYEPGAVDFIHTRPISERSLFIGKILLATLFSILCGTGAEIGLGPSAPPCRTYIAAVYLDIAFFCAAVCILFRDPVRGILFGGVAFAAVAPVVVLFWKEMTKDLIEFRPGPAPTHLLPDSSSLPLATLGVLLSPIVLLGGLSMIARFRRFGSFRITPLGVLGGLVLIAYILTVKWILAVDARTVLLTDARESNPEVLASHLGEGFVVYVEADRHSMGQSDRVRLKRLDLTDPNALSKTVAVVPMDKAEWAPYEAFLSRDRLLLYGNRKRSWEVFTLDDDFHPTLFREYSFDAEEQSGMILDASTVCIETKSRYSSSHSDPVPSTVTISGLVRLFDPETRLLNLETGELEGPSKRSVSEIVSSAAWRTDPSIPRFVNASTLLRSRAIDPPIRGPWLESELMNWLVAIRGNPVQERLHPGWWSAAMAADNWILVWFPDQTRIAVWEVAETGTPRYLGMAAIPHGHFGWHDHIKSSIFRRSDGAIGYLTPNGPLWLEFPALMKEAKGS